MKIHIDIRDGISTSIAFPCIHEVIKGGRISGDGRYYCFATSFKTPIGNVLVITRDKRKSDCFIVQKEKI